MPPESTGGLRGLLVRGQSIAFPMLIITAILVIIAPLPPLVMDLLLSCNVTIAVLIMLTTVYVKRPLEFSVFPAILLGSTLSRLVLNIASTRLILKNGATEKTEAAGGVIQAFGEFVAGDNIVIGLILFVILVAIQFLVITKGATRISEVAARFALDGMPGKQMAIDADLNAGLISSEQAKERREEVSQQADFYGAMDGASKFVRGDSIASIVITLINIVGGLYIGMVENGMNFSEAAEVFTKLTIGDGLVTQVPAFLISLAAGLIATRTSVESHLSRDVINQMVKYPEAFFLASAFLLSLSFTGMPPLPLLGLSMLCVGLGVYMQRQKRVLEQQQQVQEHQEQVQQQQQQKAEQKPEDNLVVDPLQLELGFGLIRLADPNSGGDLLDRVTRIRHKVAQEMGIILPKVRIRDNIRLQQQQYQIKVRDIPIAWGEVYPDGLLAINTGNSSGDVPGIETVEPAFGRPARWIEPAVKDRAELAGFNVVEPSAVIITHLTEVAKEHAHELLTRQQVHELLDNLTNTAPKVVEELIPDMLKTAQVHQILNNLLHEQVPVRDLETILETLSTYADRTKDLGILTEYVRHSLARTICMQYRDRNRVLRVLTLDPAVEDILAAGFDYGERGLVVKLSPQISDEVTAEIATELQKLVSLGYPPVIVCGPQVRAGLKQITHSALPKLAVLSMNEVTRDTEVEAIGQITLGQPKPPENTGPEMAGV